MVVQIKADPMVSNSVPRLSLGWVRATANTKNRRRSSISPAELGEGGMKGKHDLAPVISTGDSHKGNHHHHHNQSKHTWDSLGAVLGGGGGCWGCGEAHNPRAIVIKKKGRGGRWRVSDQQNKALSL